MKLSAVFLSCVLFSQILSAGELSIQNGTKVIEGVTVASSAEISANNETHKLDIVGAGLRSKKVLITNVKVYVAQVFVDNAGKFVRTNEGAVSSLNDMKAGAIRLTFLRNVDAATVQTSFREALAANNVNIEGTKGMSEFLAAVNDGAGAQDGKSMNISLTKLNDGTVRVVYESTKGVEKVVVGEAKMFNSIFSIWLGQSADSGLATLKAALLKGDI